jgi:hypothetical protein
LNFFANPNALSAFDTFFGITNDGFAGGINRISAALSDESAANDAERLGEGAQLTVSVTFAEQAIVGMIGEEQFDDHSSGFDDAVGLGFDFHTGTDGKGATGNECSLSFDFDDADSACSCG